MMDLSGADFQSLIDYIESDIGFPTSHYNTDYLNRRIRSRMRRSGTETIAEYRQELENCPKNNLNSSTPSQSTSLNSSGILLSGTTFKAFSKHFMTRKTAKSTSGAQRVLMAVNRIRLR